MFSVKAVFTGAYKGPVFSSDFPPVWSESMPLDSTYMYTILVAKINNFFHWWGKRIFSWFNTFLCLDWFREKGNKNDFEGKNVWILIHACEFQVNKCWPFTDADVKMETPVLVRSLKSSILSSTSFQMGKTFWGVVSAAVEQSRRKANMVSQGDGKFGPWGWPQDPFKKKRNLW